MGQSLYAPPKGKSTSRMISSKLLPPAGRWCSMWDETCRKNLVNYFFRFANLYTSPALRSAVAAFAGFVVRDVSYEQVEALLRVLFR